MNFHKKSLIAKAIIALALLLIACFIIDKASAKIIDSTFTYKVLYLPRTQQICNDNMYWVEYNPKLEKRCRILWTEWVNEMGNAIPY